MTDYQPPTSAFPPSTSPVIPKKYGLSGIERRRIRTFFLAMLFLSPSLIIFLAFVFIPLVRSFWLSTYITDPIGRPAAFVGLEQYRRMFATPVFLNSLSR